MTEIRNTAFDLVAFAEEGFEGDAEIAADSIVEMVAQAIALVRRQTSG